MRLVGGTSGCWRARFRNITFIYETGLEGLLAVGMLFRGILLLYLRPVEGTSGCGVLGGGIYYLYM
jgi:hypothetical protein